MTPFERPGVDEAVARFVSQRDGGAHPSPPAGDALDRVAHVWERSGALADDPAILALRRQALRRSTPARPWARLGRRGAGLALAASASAALWLFGMPRPPAPMTGIRYATAAGEQRTIRLADGTMLRLDGRSAVRVALSSSERHVDLLRGRAYFDVRHDAARPFSVDAGGGRMIDLGTRFTVDDRPEHVLVNLLAGKVEVHDARGRALALAPGEEAQYGGQEPLRSGPGGTGDPLDWTHGVITVQDMPLDQAVDLLSRYTPRPIRLAGGQEVAHRLVTGVFRIDHGDTIAETLAAALSLRAVRQGDGAFVLSGG